MGNVRTRNWRVSGYLAVSQVDEDRTVAHSVRAELAFLAPSAEDAITRFRAALVDGKHYEIEEVEQEH